MLGLTIKSVVLIISRNVVVVKVVVVVAENIFDENAVMPQQKKAVCFQIISHINQVIYKRKVC